MSENALSSVSPGTGSNTIKSFKRQNVRARQTPSMAAARTSIMSSSLPSSHRPDKKSVSFAPAVRVHLAVARWQLTTDEHSHIWTSPADTKSAQDGILDTVRHMRRLITPEGDLASDCESTLLDDDRTSRGVEHMRTRESIAARRQIKLDVVDAVLEEQHRQRCEQLENPVTVAEASMLVSKKCRTKAAIKGRRDYAVARDINQRPPSMMNKSTVVVKKTTTTTNNNATTQPRRTSPTTAAISNLSRYSAAIADVVDEEEDSVMAVVDLATLTAVSLDPAEVAKEDRKEVDCMFVNISHKRLRDKLLQRVSGLALGA